MAFLNLLAQSIKNPTSVVVRILFGLMWIEGASWKNPPFFGLYSGQDLYFWVHKAVDYPVFPLYSWFVENIVLKNFLIFGWMVFILECTLGFGFLLGIKTRLLALIALGHITNITLSVLKAPHEWHWTYIMMYMIAGVLFIYDTSDSKLSIDYWLKRRDRKTK